MNRSRTWHDRAMARADSADHERRTGNQAQSLSRYAEALDLELVAVALLDQADDLLAWSIFKRSAGWLAFRAGRLRTAEQIACSAIIEGAHPAILPEFRDLLEAIYLEPDDRTEANAVRDAVQAAVDSVEPLSVWPLTYTETYTEVDWRVSYPGFIAGVGDREELEGYEVIVRRQYGKGRRVEDRDIESGY